MLAKMPEFLKVYGPYILVGILVVIVVFAVWYYRTSQEETAHAMAWADLWQAAASQRMGDLERLTGYEEDPHLANMARVHLAMALLDEALKAYAPADTKKREQYLNRAERLLTGVVQDDQADSLARAMAHLGLASAAETKGQMETARRNYQALTSPEFSDTPYVGLARQKLAKLKELFSPVVFAKEPPPEKEAEGESGEEPDESPEQVGENQIPAPAEKKDETKSGEYADK
jgi:hypothetical protein